MTNEALQALVEEISLQDFGRPFKHQAIFNARLRSTGGRYHLVDHHIDINPRMINDFDRETLIGVIRHELVHYHLALAGLPYQHRSHEFKQLLAQVGGSRYAPTPKQSVKSKHSGRQYYYHCQKCGRQFIRHRRVNLERYACGYCGGRLQLDELVREVG
ncbi:SprT family protein [Furfurilactobacillus curtus]|uniref:Protein SprT n=1 Tax=Furfurilactobacillus curtus TaxID=1746200 RepID=A0ABQ5JP11_9LACO